MKTFTAKEGYVYFKDGITAKEICLPDNENEWELISESEISTVENNDSDNISAKSIINVEAPVMDNIDDEFDRI